MTYPGLAPYHYGEEWVIMHPQPIYGEEGVTRPGHFISFWNNTAQPTVVFHVKEVHNRSDGSVAYVTTFVGYEFLVANGDGTKFLTIQPELSSPSG